MFPQSDLDNRAEWVARKASIAGNISDLSEHQRLLLELLVLQLKVRGHCDVPDGERSNLEHICRVCIDPLPMWQDGDIQWIREVPVPTEVMVLTSSWKMLGILSGYARLMVTVHK